MQPEFLLWSEIWEGQGLTILLHLILTYIFYSTLNFQGDKQVLHLIVFYLSFL